MGRRTGKIAREQNTQSQRVNAITGDDSKSMEKYKRNIVQVVIRRDGSGLLVYRGNVGCSLVRYPLSGGCIISALGT